MGVFGERSGHTGGDGTLLSSRCDFLLDRCLISHDAVLQTVVRTVSSGKIMTAFGEVRWF